MDVSRRWPQNVYVWSPYAIKTAVRRVLLLRVPVRNESTYGRVVQAASSCTGPWGLFGRPTATLAYRTIRSRPRTRRIVCRTRRLKAERPYSDRRERDSQKRNVLFGRGNGLYMTTHLSNEPKHPAWDDSGSDSDNEDDPNPTQGKGLGQ